MSAEIGAEDSFRNVLALAHTLLLTHNDVLVMPRIDSDGHNRLISALCTGDGSNAARTMQGICKVGSMAGLGLRVSSLGVGNSGISFQEKSEKTL